MFDTPFGRIRYRHIKSESRAYLNELRLQGTGSLDLDELRRMAARFGAPRLERAADLLSELVDRMSDGV